jgi:iron complex transport system permease protein
MSARQRLVLVTLLAATPILLTLSLLHGSVAISMHDVAGTFAGDANPTAAAVISLRLPRVLGAFAIGGCLALAGVLMQVLVRNPLADPYILGVSGGAALLALLALWLGVGATLLRGFAFAGASCAMLLVFVAAHGRGEWSPVRLLLTGVVLATAWGAAITLILTLAPDAELRGMLFWLIGDLSFVDSARLEWLVLALGLLAAYAIARNLNVLAHGELLATALGVHTPRIRVVIFALSSLLAAVGVTAAGSIGFIGLAAPHLARLTLGQDHRLVLAGAVLIGGNLLLAADALARSVAAPLQIPVGVVTALLGVPLFLYLLRASR